MQKVQGFLITSGGNCVFDVNSVQYPEQLTCFARRKESEWDTHEECAICKWEWQCRYYHYEERY